MLQNASLAAIAVIFVASFVPAARAETPWQQAHPRREQVNGRLATQDARIHQERASGQITGAQAQQLHTEDRTIRTEERGMESQNGGHITTGEQRVLNLQENGVSRQIGP